MCLKEKPVRVDHIRIDVAYYADGSISYQCLEPDRRKADQLAKLRKWKIWARSSPSRLDEDLLIKIQHTLNPGGPVDALCAHLAYVLRCVRMEVERRKRFELNRQFWR